MPGATGALSGAGIQGLSIWPAKGRAAERTRYADIEQWCQMDLSDSDRERLLEAESLQLGGPPKDSEATLCIYADDLDPELVSELVGCDPTSARRKGELDLTRPKVPPAPTGQWFLEAPSALPFADKVNHLLDSTTDDSKAWDELLQSHDVVVRSAIFLESWSEEIWLDASTFGRMSSRHWPLALSMYSAEGEEILDAFLADAKRAANEPEERSPHNE